MSRRSSRVSIPEVETSQPCSLPKKRALASFTKQFQWKIASQLKPKARSTCDSGQILIPISLFDFFKNTFGVTGRFKPNETFMNFLKINNTRYMNNMDFCYFEKKNIKVKVSRTRKVVVLNENLEKEILVSGLYLFSYRFIRFEGKRTQE
jgi:hypothetical protein